MVPDLTSGSLFLELFATFRNSDWAKHSRNTRLIIISFSPHLKNCLIIFFGSNRRTENKSRKRGLDTVLVVIFLSLYKLFYIDLCCRYKWRNTYIDILSLTCHAFMLCRHKILYSLPSSQEIRFCMVELQITRYTE